MEPGAQEIDTLTKTFALEEKLIDYTGPDRVVSIDEFYSLKSDKSGATCFKSDFPQFDDFLDGGIETGELSVISGYTGNGKTLFAKSLNLSYLKQGLSTMFLSYEVMTEKLMDPFRKMPGMPLYVPLELKCMNMSWLAERIHEATLKYGCRIIFIDHLHYLVDMAVRQNTSLNIGAVMRRLKTDIAIGLNVAVFLIAHTGQPSDEKEPGIGALRDSSFIGQESDNVFMVSRCIDSTWSKPAPVSYDENRAMVKIEKARRSGTFRKTVEFVKEGEWLREF